MSDLCWLVQEPSDGGLPSMAVQYAHLFGFDCRTCNPGEASLRTRPKPTETIVALNYRTLRQLGTGQSLKLRSLVRAGAVLYIRGGFDGKEQCSLAPLSDATFTYRHHRKATAYRIEPRLPIPEVLHNEKASGDFSLPCASGISDQAYALASAHYETGEWAPFLFGMRCGEGTIVCDLLADAPVGSQETPILFRLMNHSKRYGELGALASFRLAAGVSPTTRSALNVVMDDRPANYDYLNSQRLRRYLQHVESRFPGIHVDFAWTPDQLYASRSYVETLKDFNTGIVWHGFKHHINHVGSSPSRLRSELRDGVQMVGQITRQFKVKFQPIMVFPFEAFGPEAFPILQEGGFLATFSNALAPTVSYSLLPSFMHQSVPLHEQFFDTFPVFRRHACDALTRDSLLSQVALNLPIIVVVHPDELGLRLWPYPPLPQGSRTHCDSVLAFAAEKRLVPSSLEEIAQDIAGRPRPKVH